MRHRNLRDVKQAYSGTQKETLSDRHMDSLTGKAHIMIQTFTICMLIELIFWSFLFQKMTRAGRGNGTCKGDDQRSLLFPLIGVFFVQQGCHSILRNTIYFHVNVRTKTFILSLILTHFCLCLVPSNLSKRNMCLYHTIFKH